MIFTIYKILENQFELNDSLDNYDSWSFLKENVLEDNFGKYVIKKTIYEHPCSCHPETCNHIQGKIIKEREEKIYYLTINNK